MKEIIYLPYFNIYSSTSKETVVKERFYDKEITRNESLYSKEKKLSVF